MTIVDEDTLDHVALLNVEDLNIQFLVAGNNVRAVSNVSFRLAAGKTLGIVGESGCGKSTTGLALMRLLPKMASLVQASRMSFQGRELLDLDDEDMRQIRGAEISMIFQDPMSSLNPVMKIGDQIIESIRAHGNKTKNDARKQAEELLGQVGLPDPTITMSRYPHEMSGGMRQRVMIAMAIALQPKLIIADEPTTALDPTVQAQVLELIAGLARRTGAAVILITHDFGVIAEMADEVMVMYAGSIVEKAETGMLFSNPQHPYTIGLLKSLPTLDGVVEELSSIRGSPPSLTAQRQGCPFVPRCDCKSLLCSEVAPELLPVQNSSRQHLVACHHPAALDASATLKREALNQG